jgi:hypothetical protein
MMRKLNRILRVIFIIVALFFLWNSLIKYRKIHFHEAPVAIHPLLVNPDFLVGSWIGHGGKNNEIEVKADITNDVRIPQSGTGDVSKDQMYDSFRPGGLIPPTQGTIAISGLGDDCPALSGTIDGGTAFGTTVGWTAYAGDIAESREEWGHTAGGWEDTAHLEVAGNVNPTNITGSVLVKSNSDSCKIAISFPIVLYLVQIPRSQDVTRQSQRAP